MAFTDNFDSYTTGNLVGQGGWADAGHGTTAALTVNTVIVQTSPNAVISSATDFALVKNTFTQQANGIQRFYFQVSSTADNGLMKFRLTEGGTSVMLVFTNAGNLQYTNSGANVTIQAVNANQWYQVDIQWVLSTGKARYRVDGGSWTAYDSTQNVMTGGPNGLAFGQDVGATSNLAHWDSFSEVVATASSTFLPIMGVGT